MKSEESYARLGEAGLSDPEQQDLMEVPIVARSIEQPRHVTAKKSAAAISGNVAMPPVFLPTPQDVLYDNICIYILLSKCTSYVQT